MNIFTLNIKLVNLCVNKFTTSAGVPLTYYHYGNSTLSIENLTIKFLETPFTASIERTYRKNGFLSNMSLTETFANKYTKLSDEKLQVRAMTVDDMCRVIEVTKIDNTINLKNIKYEKLLVNGANYLLASAYNNTNGLCFIGSNGVFYGSGNEQRYSTYSIFIF